MLLENLSFLAITFGSMLLVVIGSWLVSIAIRNVSIIDLLFPPLCFGIVLMAFFLTDGAAPRRMLLIVLVGVWAIRITTYLVWRGWGKGEDPRYTKLRSWVPEGRAFHLLSLRQVFLMQGIVIWVAMLPAQVGVSVPSPATLGWLAALGTIIWAIGLFFETVSDLQLVRFKANSENKGKILDTGLWRYSRHPNYFGELCVWWGIFLIASENPYVLATIIGPLAYTHLLVNVTGKKTLEKKMARERPGYQDYLDRTSGMIPWFPKRPSN